MSYKTKWINAISNKPEVYHWTSSLHVSKPLRGPPSQCLPYARFVIHQSIPIKQCVYNFSKICLSVRISIVSNDVVPDYCICWNSDMMKCQSTRNLKNKAFPNFKKKASHPIKVCLPHQQIANFLAVHLGLAYVSGFDCQSELLWIMNGVNPNTWKL